MPASGMLNRREGGSESRSPAVEGHIARVAGVTRGENRTARCRGTHWAGGAEEASLMKADSNLGWCQSDQADGTVGEAH